MEKQKVLIVDDEPKILKLLKSYFEAAGFDAVCADGGLQGLKLFEQNTIALILLDIMLPDFSGEEFCKKIRQVSSVPIIMVTAKVDEESIVRCLNMGADDYISKPFSPRQLIARAQAVLRRADPVQNASLISCGDLTLDIEKRVAVCKGKTIELTRGEYDILSLLMSKKNKIFTRDEILAAVKDADFDGFDRSIDSHIKRLRAKLGGNSKEQRYIATVYGIGYRLDCSK